MKLGGVCRHAFSKMSKTMSTSACVWRITQRFKDINHCVLERQSRGSQTKRWTSLPVLTVRVPPPQKNWKKGRKSAQDRKIKKRAVWDEQQALVSLSLKGEECNTFFKGCWHHPNRSAAERGSFTWKPGTRLTLSLLSYIVSITNPWSHIGVCFWPDVEFVQKHLMHNNKLWRAHLK